MNRFLREFDPKSADVALCGSMAHKAQWLEITNVLRQAGMTVYTPAVEEGIDWAAFTEDEAVAQKKHYIDRHIANIMVSTVTLVCNYEKNGEPGYVGANVLMEMTAAYVLGKPIYILNRPETSLYSKSLEINALGATTLDGNIHKLIDILKEGEANG